ncbi:MAG TPA: HAD family hydrolase [Vicinamibacterales bacterium]
MLVALDADDTLWHNEPLFTSRREQFCSLLTRYEPAGVPEDQLYEVEMRNLRHFGYGVKGFVLSMIETAIEITGGRIESRDVRQIIEWGREMVSGPIELLEGVGDAVEALAKEYSVILVTKGDLLDQETKLARSGLGHMFQGIEIVSDKTPDTYRKVMSRYDVRPDHFVMVGNSLRSDVLPVVEAGAHAVYVPYEMSWIHERVPPEALLNVRFHEISHIRELPVVLEQIKNR